MTDQTALANPPGAQNAPMGTCVAACDEGSVRSIHCLPLVSTEEALTRDPEAVDAAWAMTDEIAGGTT